MTEQELLARCLAKLGERPGPAVGVEVGRSCQEADELVARLPRRKRPVTG